jgi:hypothetical protein
MASLRVAFEGTYDEKRVAFLTSLGAEIVYNPALASVVVHKEKMRDQDGLPVTCRNRRVHVTEAWLEELEAGSLSRSPPLACEYDAKTRAWVNMYMSTTIASL